MVNSSTADIRSRAEFKSLFGPEYLQRLSVEKHLAKENSGKRSWSLTGYCEVCEKACNFSIDWANAYETPEGKIPSYRERLVCPHCDLNNRQRFMASYLKKLLDTNKAGSSEVYLYEQVTKFYESVVSLPTSAKIHGSEYLGHDKKPGEVINGIRHEDALALSFNNHSFDILVSNDVFEHVPDIYRAMEESFRVIRKGGRLVFSIPFHPAADITTQRAVLENNRVNHLLPEHYHGNPDSNKGSLVFYDFGWDLLDTCRSAGFQDVYMLAYYSLMYGYMGEGLQFIFVATK